MDESRQILQIRLRRVVRQRLESLQRAGVEQLHRVPSPPCALAKRTSEGETSGQVQGVTPPDPPSSQIPMQPSASPNDPVPTLSPEEKKSQLQSLCQQVQSCQLCPELVANRTQTVFGVGSPQTRLCFFGEAPGADEDRMGEPFVGRAGQLLNKIIDACGLQREDVYILNVLKCRPPKNRTPTAEEADRCRQFFERQLEIIRPDYICCLGAAAATALLATKTSLGRLRGEMHPWRWAQVVVTYHPAYLLRNPSAKRLVWEDMQMLMQQMGIKIPQR